jgi:DNA-binding NarL/FixJ family response regulator
VRKVAAHRPDIVVTDVRMPPGDTDDGLRAAREIRERFPGTAVVVLSQYVMEQAAVDLVGTDAPGIGYLLKDASLTSTRSSTRSTASPTADAHWTPTSSRG